jgi:fibronectin type 3 domain-containing protein
VKSGITVKWSRSKGYKVDGYQIYRSTKKSSGYKKIATTTKRKYKDTRSLKSGKKYYYKVRGYRKVNGKTVYTRWSKVICRTAK